MSSDMTIMKWCLEHESTWHSKGGLCDRGYAIALLRAGKTGPAEACPDPVFVEVGALEET